MGKLVNEVEGEVRGRARIKETSNEGIGHGVCGEIDGGGEEEEEAAVGVEEAVGGAEGEDDGGEGGGGGGVGVVKAEVVEELEGGVDIVGWWGAEGEDFVGPFRMVGPVILG